MASWTPEHLGPRTLPNAKSLWATTEEERQDRQGAAAMAVQAARRRPLERAIHDAVDRNRACRNERQPSPSLVSRFAPRSEGVLTHRGSDRPAARIRPSGAGGV